MTNDIHCKACGNELTEAIALSLSHWQIRRCVHCGLGRTVDLAGSDESIDLYGPAYFTGDDANGENFSNEFMRQYDNFRFVVELDELETLIPKGKILDVGCATGGFLSHARQRGWTVYGYDVSEYAIQQALERIEGVSVASGVLDKNTFSGERFDVITLHHVLEHVNSPDQFLKTNLLPLLKEGGVVLVEVPNFASLEARATGAEWEDLRPEQHEWHFTPVSLRLLLERQGLTAELLRTLHAPLWRTRMLTDHLLMAASLLFHIPYGGHVGRKLPTAFHGREANVSSPLTASSCSLLTCLSGLLGRPMMAFLNRNMLGKRLVMVGCKEGSNPNDLAVDCHLHD